MLFIVSKCGEDDLFILVDADDMSSAHSLGLHLFKTSVNTQVCTMSETELKEIDKENFYFIAED